MNRKQLLELSLNEDKNVENLVDVALSEDKRFIKRAKRNLEDEIEDLQAELRKRLSSNTPVDKSVVEVSYSQIKLKKEMLETYKSFESEYLTVE